MLFDHLAALCCYLDWLLVRLELILRDLVPQRWFVNYLFAFLNFNSEFVLSLTQALA